MQKLNVGDVIELKRGHIINGEILEMFHECLSPVSNKLINTELIIGKKYIFQKGRAHQYLIENLEQIENNLNNIGLSENTINTIKDQIIKDFNIELNKIKSLTFIIEPNEFVITKVIKSLDGNREYFIYYCKPLKDGVFDDQSSEFFIEDNYCRYDHRDFTVIKTLKQVFV